MVPPARSSHNPGALSRTAFSTPFRNTDNRNPTTPTNTANRSNDARNRPPPPNVAGPVTRHTENQTPAAGQASNSSASGRPIQTSEVNTFFAANRVAEEDRHPLNKFASLEGDQQRWLFVAHMCIQNGAMLKALDRKLGTEFKVTPELEEIIRTESLRRVIDPNAKSYTFNPAAIRKSAVSAAGNLPQMSERKNKIKIEGRVKYWVTQAKYNLKRAICGIRMPHSTTILLEEYAEIIFKTRKITDAHLSRAAILRQFREKGNDKAFWDYVNKELEGFYDLPVDDRASAIQSLIRTDRARFQALPAEVVEGQEGDSDGANGSDDEVPPPQDSDDEGDCEDNVDFAAEIAGYAGTENVDVNED